MKADELLVTAGCFAAVAVLTAAAGLVLEWARRRLAARLQSRTGPGPLQPLRDLLKLARKETIVPDAAQQAIFMLMPIVALAGVSATSLLVWGASVCPGLGFEGDLILILYLLVLPGVALAVGACASGNPLAAIGGARQMKLIVAALPPLILAVATVLFRTARPGGGLGQVSFALADILEAQRGSYWMLETGSVYDAAPRLPVLSASGFIAFMIAIISAHGLLGMRPFDCADAGPEIAGGVYAEYGGPMLAVWMLVRMMMLVTLSVFVATLFLGGGRTMALPAAAAALGIAATISLLAGVMARVRIDQAVRFFWLDLGLLGLLALVLAAAGY